MIAAALTSASTAHPQFSGGLLLVSLEPEILLSLLPVAEEGCAARDYA